MKPSSIIVSVLLLSLTYSTDSFSQSYPIPNASVQPSWVFPIFIEDTFGQKDSIYIGYDDNLATGFGCYDEGFFGEEKTYRASNDTSFAVFTCRTPYPNNVDSISKVNILDDLTLPYSIMVRNAYLPLKLSWDSDLFWSDSIPFSALPGLPKAEAVLEWYFGSSIPKDVNCGMTPILISDTCNYYCCKPDSVIFIEPTNPQGPIKNSLNLFIQFKPWSGVIVGISNQDQNEIEIKLYPTIFNETIVLEGYSVSSQDVTLQLLDMSGQECYNVTLPFASGNNRIDVKMPDLKGGIYTALITTRTSIRSKRLIRIE